MDIKGLGSDLHILVRVCVGTVVGGKYLLNTNSSRDKDQLLDGFKVCIRRRPYEAPSCSDEQGFVQYMFLFLP